MQLSSWVHEDDHAQGVAWSLECVTLMELHEIGSWFFILCSFLRATRDWMMKNYKWTEDLVSKTLNQCSLTSILIHFLIWSKHHATELMFHLRDARWVVYLIGLKCHYRLESQIFTNCSAFLSAPCRLSLPSLWGELSLVTRPAWCSILYLSFLNSKLASS